MRSERRERGFIAQQIETLEIPGAVSESSEGFKALDNTPIVASLVLAVQAQHKTIHELLERIAQLEEERL